jgi:hypothetical protein
MSVIDNSLLLTAPAGGGSYQISRSLRFNAPDSAYLSKNFASAGNRKTWTWAGWVKRSYLGSNNKAIFSASGSSSDYVDLRFESDGIRADFQASGQARSQVTTTAVFRDPSAWYHIVFAIDSTQATAADRVKIYVNNVAQSTSNTINQNIDFAVNSTSAHNIGRRVNGSDNYLDGYLADIHFIDGQALDPTSFGEFSATTGVWVPKAFTGSYGTNGFKLDFADNSSNTATTLGKDTSPNGNNWTPNNLSVTAGAGNDSLVDVPTNGAQTDTGAGGEVRGNYATLNPLAGSGTLANGNLDISGTFYRTSTIGLSSGKWYWEITIGSVVSNSWLGLYLDPADSGGNFVITGPFAQYTNAGGTFSVTSASLALGDIIGIAANFDTGTITWYKNGSTAVVLTGATLNTKTWLPGCHVNASAATNWTFNAGARPFAYTAPSGFKALNTANLPAPVVTQPNTVMDVLLWSGNGSNPRTFTGLNFSPDFVWLKTRNSGAWSHCLFDQLRGNAVLHTNLTNAETATHPYGYVSAFTSNGFTVAAGSSGDEQVNDSALTYVGWAWDAGSSTVTNTVGSITSQVRANPSAGFSVVSYTSTGSSQTAGHGLGVASPFIIQKRRDGTGDWYVGTTLVDGSYDILVLNSTAAKSDAVGVSAPTSTVFSTAWFGTGSENWIAYCFAPVSGYSSFGSYTGNGSSDGPFVYTGFRPKYVLIKASSTGGSYYYWYLYDSVRSPYNATAAELNPNVSDQEGAGYQQDLLSNGFKVRSNGIYVNNSGVTYIYAAFAENPFQYARAR